MKTQLLSAYQGVALWKVLDKFTKAQEQACDVVTCSFAAIWRADVNESGKGRED